MTAKEFVTRNCQQRKLALIKPTRACPGILAHDWSTGFGKCVIDAGTWAEAKDQLVKWAKARSA